MQDGPWEGALSSKAPTHQPLPQPAWRSSLSPPRRYFWSPPRENPPAGPSQLPRHDQTPPLSSGPASTSLPQSSVVPTSGVAPGVSDASTPWPPPECMRLAQWYAVDVEGVDAQEEPLAWVNQNSHLGVLVAWKVKPIQKKGAIYHMYLLFKDMAKQDSCRSVLVSLLSGKTLLPFLYMDTLVNCFGVCEVRYMQEVYINAVSTAEVQELLVVGHALTQCPVMLSARCSTTFGILLCSTLLLLLPSMSELVP
ncbi:hypothetical protein BS47DRAFT_1366719 [Hydnum rufescens UP504]|uniref:Uncharacterized protein n=1 Tax=Hydnum rufescens UP504 TaxID=1448309 RepID=A0A9P6DLV3_9AGAM|nr:hypothetical protein BS47DRAFT_1366719 [Hydnum rufescens UP504]